MTTEVVEELTWKTPTGPDRGDAPAVIPTFEEVFRTDVVGGSGIGHQAENGMVLYAVAYYRQRLTKPSRNHPYGRWKMIPGSMEHEYMHASSVDHAIMQFGALCPANPFDRSMVIAEDPETGTLMVAPALGVFVHDTNGDVRTMEHPDDLKHSPFDLEEGALDGM